MVHHCIVSAAFYIYGLKVRGLPCHYSKRLWRQLELWFPDPQNQACARENSQFAAHFGSVDRKTLDKILGPGTYNVPGMIG